MDNMSAVFAAIKKHNMIQKGNTVIVALSGGADSVALFHFLFSAREALGIIVQAANVDHSMRGEASEQDSAYVRLLCERYGVKLHFKKLVPTGSMSEEWARNERYAFFDKLNTSENIRIATAHTASDNAETVLLNLCRGTALRGAGGIPPKRGAYIRPFIAITRRQTEEYCAENKLEYVLDATNLTAEYARGRVRNVIMPMLSTVHEGADKALARFACEAREVDEYITAKASELLQGARVQQGEKRRRFIEGEAYRLCDIRAMPPCLQKNALEQILPRDISINADIIAKGVQLINTDSGELELARRYRLVNMQNTLFIEKLMQNSPFSSLPIKEGNYHVFGRYSLCVQLCDYNLFINSLFIQKKDLIFSADYGKIKGTVYFRTRKSGDTYTLQHRNITKTVKKLMNEAGLARQAREQLPLLANGSEILWMPIFGFSEGLAADENTQTVINITLKYDLEEE